MRARTGSAGNGRIRRVRRGTGFTLFEVMVALVILAIGITGVWATTRLLLRMNDFSFRLSDAVCHASAKIEDLKRAGYNAAASGSDTVGIFSRSWTVASGPVAGTRQVAVTMNWTDIAGISRTKTVRTMIGIYP